MKKFAITFECVFFCQLRSRSNMRILKIETLGLILKVSTHIFDFGCAHCPTTKNILELLIK